MQIESPEGKHRMPRGFEWIFLRTRRSILSRDSFAGHLPSPPRKRACFQCHDSSLTGAPRASFLLFLCENIPRERDLSQETRRTMASRMLFRSVATAMIADRGSFDRSMGISVLFRERDSRCSRSMIVSIARSLDVRRAWRHKVVKHEGKKKTDRAIEKSLVEPVAPVESGLSQAWIFRSRR